MRSWSSGFMIIGKFEFKSQHGIQMGFVVKTILLCEKIQNNNKQKEGK